MTDPNVILVFYSVSTQPILLGRTPINQCEGTTLTCQSCEPFESRRFTYDDDATLNFQIGPSAGESGYTGITGEGMRGGRILCTHAIPRGYTGIISEGVILTKGPVYT